MSGEYEIFLDSANEVYGGKKKNKIIKLKAKKEEYNDYKYTITPDIDGLSTIYLKRIKQSKTTKNKSEVK